MHSKTVKVSQPVKLFITFITGTQLFKDILLMILYFIGESTMWRFWDSMATNWSIMAARAQVEQVKLEKFNLKGMKSMED